MTTIPEPPHQDLPGYWHGKAGEQILTAYPVTHEFYTWMRRVSIGDYNTPECDFLPGKARVLVERFGIRVHPLPTNREFRKRCLDALRSATRTCQTPGEDGSMFRDQAELAKVLEAKRGWADWHEYAGGQAVVDALRNALATNNPTPVPPGTEEDIAALRAAVENPLNENSNF